MNAITDILPGLPRPDVATTAAPIDLSEPTPIKAEVGETIWQIFERQNFLLPTIAFLNGEVILRADWDQTLLVGTALMFLQLPAGGDGDKDIFRFVLQLAVTVVAGFALGPAGVGLTGTALQVGVAAASLAGGYLINLALPPSAAELSSGYSAGETASPTYSISAQGNQARLGSMIPRVYGRHVLVPDFAALPYTEYAGNELFLYQLFSLGLGHSQVHKVNIAKTELWNEDDGYSDSFDDIEIEIVPPGQSVTLAPFNVITSTEVSGQTLKGTNEDGAGYIGPFPVCGPDDEPNYIAFDFVFRGGAGHLTDSGAINARSIIVRQEVQMIDASGDPIGEWVVLDETIFSFATRTGQRVSKRYPSAGGRFQGRCKRMNAAADDARDWDEVTWDALRAYLPGDNTYPCQVLAVKMRATNQLSSQAARDFSVVQTSKLPSYDGEEWSAPTPTRRIFDIAMDVLRNDEYSAAHPDDRIDVDALYAMQATWASRGDTFDGVFDQTQSVWDVLTTVLRVGRARPIEIGDTVSFVRDELQTVPRMLITPRQAAEGSFNLHYALFEPTTPDDVVIEYMDERTWDIGATVRATLEGSTSQNPSRVRIKGIVDRTRAWKYGMYLAASNKYRREFPTLNTEFDGRLLSPLDLVSVAHLLCDWGRAADVIDFDQEARSVTLSQKALLSSEGNNYMLLRRRNGTPWGPVLVVEGDAPEIVIMDEDELDAITATQGDPFEFIVSPDSADDFDDDMEPTTAVLGSGEMYAANCKLLEVRKQSGSQITLSLVADDERVYSAGETGSPPAEENPSPLPTTPKGPVIEKLDVIVRGERFRPILDASIRPAPGALNYIWQLSYDHVNWQPLQDGLALSWSGEVSPTTIWLRVTAIGAVRGEPKEWFQDLTATSAAPAALSGISVKQSIGNAFIKFSLPVEDGIKGVLVKYSTEDGFDPETEGTTIDYVPAVGEVIVPIASGEIYVRLAAYNAFGTAGLNWSSEYEITSLALTEEDLPSSVIDALDAAESYGDSVVFKVTDEENNAGGLVLQADGTSVTAAWLANKFLIATPGGNIPLVIIDEGGARFTNLIAKNITADDINAVNATAIDLRGGRFRGLDTDNFDINPTDGYISLKRPE